MYKNSISLHDRRGQRKYLNQRERLQFLEVTKVQPTPIRLFCQLLYYTGARISEIHNLSPACVDILNGTVAIESLKKRQRGIYREIPIPDALLQDLEHYIQEGGIRANIRIWPFSLRTASRQIKNSMIAADIKGIHSSAKGLRHGFAVNAVEKAPLTMIKKWLGHSALETTEIYLNIVGKEEREMAKRIWQ